VTQSTIPVAVVGAGAFGRNHARIYHALQEEGAPVRLAAVVDREFAHATHLAEQFPGAQAFASTRELVSQGQVRAASVAVPTSEHLAVGRELMQAGIDVLIEKPLASSTAESDELIETAARTNVTAQVGHLERFNPAVVATAALLTTPMFFEVHRLSVFTPRSLDVDVVLDLMIHDLDVVGSFVRSPVKAVHAVGLPILTEKVDIANVRMEFESGCIANFTASRVSTERVRKLRFFQPRQYISTDYTRQDVMVFTVDAGHAGPGAAGAAAQIKMARPEVRPCEPLRAEIESFLDCVRRRVEPRVPLAEGRTAVAMALEIQAAIAQHSRAANLAALNALLRPDAGNPPNRRPDP
jgi:predicted dehydrogenase